MNWTVDYRMRIVFYSFRLEEASCTQSTIIVQIIYSLKQSKHFAELVFKKMKANELPTGHLLYLVICLSMMKIHKYAEMTVQFLKQKLSRFYQDKKRSQQLGWIQFPQTTHFLYQDLFNRLIQKSVYGWEDVIEPCMELAFNLLEMGKTEYELNQLGQSMIQTMMEENPLTRRYIVEQLCNKIMSKNMFRPNHSTLLALMLEKCPEILDQDNPKVNLI
jgi:hypothetical protein